MARLGLIRGEQSGRTGRTSGEASSGRVGATVHAAIGRGFAVGRRVRIGRVVGTVIGYNIACSGQFPGAVYPLLVHTRFGISKCGPTELSLA